MTKLKLKKLPKIEFNVKVEANKGALGQLCKKYQRVPDGFYQRESDTIKDQIKRFRKQVRSLKISTIALDFSIVHAFYYKVKNGKVIKRCTDSISLSWKIVDILKKIKFKILTMINPNMTTYLDPPSLSKLKGSENLYYIYCGCSHYWKIYTTNPWEYQGKCPECHKTIQYKEHYKPPEKKWEII